MLEYGANVNKRYFFGAEINLVTETDAIELLLSYGADTETCDRAGMTPLMRAARHSHEMEQVLLLLSHGANVNAMTDSRNDYRTVLHYAVLSGNTAVVTMLIKQGAKVDQLPPSGEPDRPSPLDLAILRGDPAMVRLLLEKGAIVNRASPVIGTPLHVVCADNIAHRVEIMKVNIGKYYEKGNVITLSFVFSLFRCFCLTGQILILKSTAMAIKIRPLDRHLLNYWRVIRTFCWRRSVCCCGTVLQW